MDFTLRKATAEDEAFLYRLYASTRAGELAATGWNAEQQEHFLKMQFRIQHNTYAANWPQAEHHIVIADEQPVGHIIFNRADKEILTIDLALLPEYRGLGIGSALLKNVLAEGAQSGKPVVLHVLKQNVRAISLYERLGFRVCADVGMYFRMDCHPA